MVWVTQGERVYYAEESVRFTDQWTYYEKHLPRLLSGFSTELVRHAPLQGGGHGEPIQIDYSIACVCGGGISQISVTADGSDSENRTFLVSAKCRKCDSEQVIFDLQRHGYDAENGAPYAVTHVEAYEIGLSNDDLLVVSLYYTDDGFSDEREAFARGELADGPRPEDCFTWIRFTRMNTSGTESLLDFECA